MGQSSLVDFYCGPVPLALLPVRDGVPQSAASCAGRRASALPAPDNSTPHLRRAAVAHHVFAWDPQRDGPVRLDPFEFARDAVPPPPAGLGAVLLELEPDRGGRGLRGVYRTEDVDEPLLDELPLDDELPDDDDDVVLSSSLSTSRFLRGLSLTPPRRGLSLMPRLSIVYVGGRAGRMGMGLPWAALVARAVSCQAGAGQQHLAALGWGLARWPTSVSREVAAVREDGLRRLPCGSEGALSAWVWARGAS